MSGTVWIVGGDSRIGRALAGRLARSGVPTVATTRRAEPGHSGPDGAGSDRVRLDLDGDVSGFVPPDGVAAVVLCAAVTAQARCREDWERSWRVNVENTLRVAGAFRRRGALVVFPSSNLVFDGSRPFRRPGERASPVCAYGRLKAEAEAALLARGGAAVVRLTKVVPPDFPLFARWAADLRAGRPIRPFADMAVAPVTPDAVVAALLAVCVTRAEGIHHISGDADVTYGDAARRLAARLGAPAELVQSASWREAGLDAGEVPDYATLDMAETAVRLGCDPVPLEAVLDGLAGTASITA